MRLKMSRAFLILNFQVNVGFAVVAIAWVTSVAERMMTVLSLCLAVAQRFVALV
jgi:hypothetical protein